MALAVAKYPTGVAEPLELPDELYVYGDSPLKLSWLMDEASGRIPILKS
jgi:hypothetical protein